MVKASNKEYVQLEDSNINQTVELLKSWKYTQKEWDRIIPYLSQLFYNNNIAIESTCLILSGVTDITSIETKIDELYKGLNIPYLETDLIEKIGEGKYTQLLKRLKTIKKPTGTSTYQFDEQTRIITNFTTKKIIHVKDTNRKDGKAKITPVIEAVPSRLIVYDSPFLNLPRAFKITWTSKYSNRNFTTGDGLGSTISEISQYLIDAGFGVTNKLVKDSVTSCINSMIADDLAEVKTDIDNKGVYYNVDDDRVLAVKLDYSEINESEMLVAVDVLDELAVFFRGNEDVLASVFKWALMSIFSYAMKQVGNPLPYLYLKGTSGSGKTTLGKIGLYVYDVPSFENEMGGSSFDTEYRIGNRLNEDCTPRLVNEPAAVFKRNGAKELIKVCVQSTVSRVVKGKVYSAFSPVIFTANNYLPDDDALVNRMFVLNFTYSQRKSKEEKEAFKEAFYIDTPKKSRLIALHTFGRFAVREVMANPSLLFDDWKVTADYILNEFYTMAMVEKPRWLSLWSETEGIDDYDDNQTEELRSFFISSFNQVRSRVTLKDEYGNRKEKLDIDGVSEYDDFESLIWQIINERLISWCLPKKGKDGDYVCLTQILRKTLKKEMDYSNDLKSIAELLKWEYTAVRLDNKTKWVIKVPFDVFLEFLYPSVGDAE